MKTPNTVQSPPNIYQQMDKLLDEYPSSRVFEALKESIELILEKERAKTSPNHFRVDYWRLQLQDAERMSKRADKQAGIR